MLSRMVEEGDVVVDREGNRETIQYVVDNLAVTDKWLKEFSEFNIFIARFHDSDRGEPVETFNKYFTLEEDM